MRLDKRLAKLEESYKSAQRAPSEVALELKRRILALKHEAKHEARYPILAYLKERLA